MREHKSHNDMWKENIRANSPVKEPRKLTYVPLAWRKDKPRTLGVQRQPEHHLKFNFGPKKGQAKGQPKGFELLEQKWAEENPPKPKYVKKKLTRLEDRLRFNLAKARDELIIDERFDKNCDHQFTHKSNRNYISCANCGLEGERGEIESVLGPVNSKRLTKKPFPKNRILDEPEPERVKHYKTWAEMAKDKWGVPQDKLNAEREARRKLNNEGRADQGKPTRKPLKRTGRNHKNS